MKKLICLSSICFLVMFFAECKKDSNYSKSIIGTWELNQNQSGMTPGTTFSKGNGNVLKFTSSTYEIYKDNVLFKSGAYTLIPDTSVETNVCLVLSNKEYKSRIVFDGKDDPRKTFIKISNNELSLVSGCFALDAGSISIYNRK
jgi:hypothetical protein